MTPFRSRIGNRESTAETAAAPNDRRLRDLELDVREIKTRMENVATANDIDKLKLWAAGGALVGTLSIIGWLVVWISRLLASAPPTG